MISLILLIYTSLSNRRLVLLSNLFYNSISGNIDCPELLSLIRFKIISYKTGNAETFYSLSCNKNYILNSTANLLMIALNKIKFDYIISGT